MIYTGGTLEDPDMAKTAHAIARFLPDQVHSVWDSKSAGALLSDIVPGSMCRAPVVSALDQGLDEFDLVIGFAPIGGDLTESQRADLAAAMRPGIRLVNGLHEPLDLPGTLNLRHLHATSRPIAQGMEFDSFRVLTVGTSHAMGKMTATVAVHEEMSRRSVDVAWVATGQTGMILAGEGRVLDSIPVDFVPGHIEQMLSEVDREGRIVLVEGQGSIFHPSYSGLTASLFHTVAPQAFVLCARIGQDHHLGFRQRIPSVQQALEGYAALGAALGVKSSCVAVSLDSSRSTPERYYEEKARLSQATGLVVVDPVYEGSAELIADAILARMGEGV
ncbi:DUF1611 domain-containing protein [Nocardioides piscis]|uniref:DUF1611 domain-containing protein n=1 Tax=Nocardioides piscis TaxID=2714938 RepID=A0A6G7YJ73_9ACTN|nr:DUF1611 domain-containing protein [Nocardioides piscis]QIK76794.1 DUF1611 domain-containing protein [Nocardioides piscis]